MQDGILRVDLTGILAGKHLLLKDEELTLGFLEDLQTTQIKDFLDALSRAVIGGDLPKGTDRPGLRKLKVSQVAEITRAIAEAMTLSPKE